MLLSLSEALETPVSVLLGETLAQSKPDDLKVISEKLEVINQQLAQRKNAKQKTIRWLLIALCAGVGILSAVLTALGSPYLDWDFRDPETAVVGAAFHVLEWLFFRLAPIVLFGAGVGIFLTCRKR